MNATDWALTRNLPATAKLLLVGLAWLADDEGVTYKGRETIAARMGTDTRWVGRYLRVLAEAGLITRYRRHRANGSRTSNIIVLNMPRVTPLDLSNYSGLIGDREPGDAEPTGESSPVDLEARIGQTLRRECVEPTGENRPPQSQPVGEHRDQTGQGARARAVNQEPEAPNPKAQLPDDFPPELVPHARRVWKILKGIAVEHGVLEPWPQAVGRLLASRPRRPVVRAANDLAVWAVDPPRPIKDVVATYRTFLDRERDLAGTERLDESGNPVGPGPASGSTRRGSGVESPRDRQLRERQERDDASLTALQEMSAELGIGDANQKEDEGAG